MFTTYILESTGIFEQFASIFTSTQSTVTTVTFGMCHATNSSAPLLGMHLVTASFNFSNDRVLRVLHSSKKNSWWGERKHSAENTGQCLAVVQQHGAQRATKRLKRLPDIPTFPQPEHSGSGVPRSSLESFKMLTSLNAPQVVVQCPIIKSKMITIVHLGTFIIPSQEPRRKCIFLKSRFSDEEHLVPYTKTK